MARPWHRSPVLWFGLPGLIFFIVAWVDSMSWDSRLELTAFGRPVTFQNADSAFGCSFYESRRASHGGKLWDLHSSREPDQGRSWFPLPSYYSNDAYTGHRWHNVEVSYWFLILAYLGLWQLPWLLRYHRRQLIERSLKKVSP